MAQVDEWQTFMGIIGNSNSIRYKDIEDPTCTLREKGLEIPSEYKGQLQKLFKNLKRISRSSQKTLGDTYANIIQAAPRMTYRQLRDPTIFGQDFPEVQPDDIEVVQKILQDVVQIMGQLQWPDNRMEWIRNL